MRAFFPAGVLVLGVLASTVVHAEFPSKDTREHDPLDDLNFAAGEGGTVLGNGESVHMFNGNLQVVHPASPSYPVDGGMSFGLSRVYNSNSVVSEYVVNNGDTLRGVSWVGLGWKMHLGRFYSTTEYNANTSPVYKKKRYFFETSAGTLINVEWVSNENRYKYRKRPSPAIYAEYFPPCGTQEPDAPVCDDGLAPPCTDNAPAPGSSCPGRPDNDPAHYRVTFPNGTVYRMEKIVPYQYTGNRYLKNADRAGYYTTQITDPADNWIRVSYNTSDPCFRKLSRASGRTVARPLVTWTSGSKRAPQPTLRPSALQEPLVCSNESWQRVFAASEQRRRPSSMSTHTTYSRSLIQLTALALRPRSPFPCCGA